MNIEPKIFGNRRFTRGSMAETKDDGADFETRDEIDAALIARTLKAVSDDQLERWRGAGLLPRVIQVPNAYHGSSVRHSVGTAAQVCAIVELLAQKQLFDFVGWELWWRGFPVDEKYWKPTLVEAAKAGDRRLKKIRKRMAQNDQINSDDLSAMPRTMFDEIRISGPTNFIFSRVLRRIKNGELPILMRTLAETAVGRFDGFEPPTGDNGNSDGEIAARAFDLEKSQKASVKREIGAWPRNLTDLILDQQSGFADALPVVLDDLSRAHASSALMEAIERSRPELLCARDDVRNVLQIATDMHDALKWIYGPKAFGLRLAAWLARHLSREKKAELILHFVLFRRMTTESLSSAEIQELATAAAVIRDQSLRIRYLGENDPRLKTLFAPRSLRRALQSRSGLETFVKKARDATAT